MINNDHSEVCPRCDGIGVPCSLCANTRRVSEDLAAAYKLTVDASTGGWLTIEETIKVRVDLGYD